MSYIEDRTKNFKDRYWFDGRSNRQTCSLCREKIPREVKRITFQARVRDIVNVLKICPSCLYFLNKGMLSKEKSYIKKRNQELLLDKI